MRVLHTSDWHLGRSFGTQSLLEDQVRFLGWLCDVVAKHRVEIVVVAGDVFDRAVPPADAVAAWRDHLVALRRLGARVVAIAGNHDHVVRLSAYDGLTDDAGIWVRGGHERAGEIVEIDGSDGSIAVVPVPFLDPLLARTVAGDGGTGEADADAAGAPRATHESVLRGALDRARAAVGGRRSIAIAHAWVQGGEQSESERMLSVGGAGQVDVSLFDGFSYVALGHLHRPQVAGGRGTVRYSGSPLPYSFSENHEKQVLLVDLDAEGRVDTRPIPVEVGRAVATIEGTIDDLLEARIHERVKDHWIRARLTDRELVLDARQRLRKRFPHVVEVVQVALQEAPGEHLAAGAAFEPTKSPLDVSLDFWRAVTGTSPDDAVRELLRGALEGAHSSGEQS